VVLLSGLGFFADAYDLFVIGIVSTLLKSEWHLGSTQLAQLHQSRRRASYPGILNEIRFAGIYPL
jgi:PHS family inorganic phosphate transporter-like MFS transporter